MEGKNPRTEYLLPDIIKHATPINSFTKDKKHRKNKTMTKQKKEHTKTNTDSQ